jgi:hypothetical protein
MPRIWEVPADGPLLSSEDDARDLIGETYGSGAEIVAIPVERLAPDFWVLSNQKAGHFIQKFVNYGLHVAIIGDVSAYVDKSKALRDFVRESNRRGRELRFVPSRESLER